jgi:hypothetical protein
MALLNVCRFVPTLGGTTDWTYAAAVTGYQSPAAAGAIDTQIYVYRAESADLSQWEIGSGVYNLGANAFARTTVLYNSLGTGTAAGQTGAGTKINFLAVPQVAIDAIAQNLPVPRGYLAGLTLSTAGGSAAFGIAAGAATDSSGASMMALAAPYTKTTSAWTVGSGNGALDTGAIANSTWYHVYEIQRPDTGLVDIAISLSASAPTLGANIPSAYTLSRRIGSMRTDGSAHWLAFVQVGDEFLWSSVASDLNISTLGTAAIAVTLTVPTGIVVLARYRANSAGSIVLLNSPDESSVAVNATVGNISLASGGAGELLTRTNTSAQIRAVANLSSTILQIATFGWFDRRGRDT